MTRAINVDSYFRDSRGYTYEEHLLNKLGSELILASVRTVPEIIQACAGCEIVMVEHPDTPINEAAIGGLPDCNLILKYAVGVDNVDLQAATNYGIVVCHIPNFCVEEVSDHAAAMLLALARQVVPYNDSVRGGGWAEFTPEPPMRRLRNRVLGLVGFGRIARRFAEKMRSFGVKVLVFDPFIDQQTAQSQGATLVSREELFAQSDFVSVHTPLTQQTRHSIGADLLKLMKPTSSIINTSRGPVIDEVALSTILQENRIAGAALDVTEVEPLPASGPLRKLHNVLITPHCAANSVESLNDLRYTGAASLEAYCKGYLPEFVANPGVRPKQNLKPWKEFAASDNRLVRLDPEGKLVESI
jgi:D-3-phosphoglycerate dehydrogenase / 2-oxoglutarate reductase